MECLFCNIGNTIDETFVRDCGNWILRVNPYQFLLGVCVLVHKDHKEGISSLSDEEIVEAHNNIKMIEKSLRKSFSPDWFNYFQTNNNIRHFHYHIVPRYKSTVTFLDHEFIDSNFTGMPIESSRKLPDEAMKKLIETINSNL